MTFRALGSGLKVTQVVVRKMSEMHLSKKKKSNFMFKNIILDAFFSKCV